MKNLFRVGLVTRHARTRPYSDIDRSVYMSFKVLLERTKKEDSTEVYVQICSTYLQPILVLSSFLFFFFCLIVCLFFERT